MAHEDAWTARAIVIAIGQRDGGRRGQTRVDEAFAAPAWYSHSPSRPAACGSGFEVVRLREPVTASRGGLRVQVRQLQISDDVASDGLSDDSEIVAEVTVANLGQQRLRAAAVGADLADGHRRAGAG